MIIVQSANVSLMPTITRNHKNLIYYVSNTTVDLWWSHQYGCHWLHLFIVDALSSSSFEISELSGVNGSSTKEFIQLPETDNKNFDIWSEGPAILGHYFTVVFFR